MPLRVDFYLLTSNSPDTRLHFACRLLEKAYLRGYRVFAYIASQEQAKNLDNLLWTFRDISFVPHHLQGENITSPIEIGICEPSDTVTIAQQVLLNLHHEVPEFFHQYQRVIEIISNDNSTKQLGREHYRVYQAKQCKLNTHNI